MERQKNEPLMHYLQWKEQNETKITAILYSNNTGSHDADFLTFSVGIKIEHWPEMG